MMPLLFWPTLNSFKMYYQNDLDSFYHFFKLLFNVSINRLRAKNQASMTTLHKINTYSLPPTSLMPNFTKCST